MANSDISHPRSFHRLIYASRHKARSPAELELQLRSIIETSVRNNARVSVTGLLLTCGPWFLQVLEGGAEAVMTTYGRILRDPRHQDSQILSSSPVDKGLFSAWSMCARSISPSDDAILATLDRKGALDPTRMTPEAALRLLTAVAAIQQRSRADEVAA